MKQSGTLNPALVSGLLGLAGGAAVIVALEVSTRGWWALLPYALLIVALLLYFRRAAISGFMRRFGLAFLTYLLTTLVGYGYASAINKRGLLADLGRQAGHLLVLAAIGAVGCLLLAAISKSRQEHGAARP
jgi:hypothetical protein